MIRGIGQMETARSVLLDGRGGLLLKYANGTIIEPAEVAPPSTLVNADSMKRRASRTTVQHLQKQSCTKNSWKGGEVLTKPADNVQIVVNSMTGPATIGVFRAKSQYQALPKPAQALPASVTRTPTNPSHHLRRSPST
jgi:hypothetical protein